LGSGGVAFNIRVARIVESKDGSRDIRNKIRFLSGLVSSSLEHAVPIQMFGDPLNRIEGISAVKAIQLAMQSGQKIFQIDQSNVNQALSELSLDVSVENEISSVVRQGRVVITHSSNVSIPGWSGAGYIILDPEIMDGSYKITGGSNGGFWSGFLIGLAISLFAAASLFPFLAPLLVIIGVMLASGGFMAGLMGGGGLRCFALGLTTGIVAGAAIIGLLALGGLPAGVSLTGLGATADILTLLGVVDALTGGQLLNYGNCIG